MPPSSGGIYGWWGTTYAWAPDGRQLAYARADEIGLVRIPGGSLTPLAHFSPYRTYATWVWAPTVSWSPDGDFLVAAVHTPGPSDAAREDSPRFDVWALAADRTIKATLVDDVGMWAAPSFAHEGSAIAFGQARSPSASRTSGYDLYVIDRDGSNRQRVFPSPGEQGLGYPEIAWGPGGDRLILIYRGNLYLITLPDGEVLPLTADGVSTAIEWRW